MLFIELNPSIRSRPRLNPSGEVNFRGAGVRKQPMMSKSLNVGLDTFLVFGGHQP